MTIKKPAAPTHSAKSVTLGECQSNPSPVESTGQSALMFTSGNEKIKTTPSTSRLVGSAAEKQSVETGKGSRPKQSEPTEGTVSVAKKTIRNSSLSTTQKATGRSIGKKDFADGGFISGSKNRDSQRKDFDSSAGTATVLGGNTVNAHTPGPWTKAGYGVLGPKGKLADSIAITSVREDDPKNMFGLSTLSQPEREANARLIAAAPELLDAAIYAACPKCDHNRCHGLRVAISKATGEGR